MNQSDLTRRDWIKTLGIGTGFAAGLGILNDRSALADLRARRDAPAGKQVQGSETPPCRWEDGHVIRPEISVPRISETDVLVVGGGAAGCAAAVAAARAGVKVALVERYGYFGGLVTGGLVLKILAHRAENNLLVGRGLTEEMLQRLLCQGRREKVALDQGRALLFRIGRPCGNSSIARTKKRLAQNVA